MSDKKPAWIGAVEATIVPAETRKSGKPEPFGSLYALREKRPLGDHFGLKTFGVNLTRLPPGATSALLHRHSRQDELVYILEGEPTLVTDQGESLLRPGMCAGFPAGGVAHQLVNRSAADVLYLEIGDRAADDCVEFPADDLEAVRDADGKWYFTHKDGTPY